MGEYLAKINQIPEKTICSTALRAKRTAELAIRGGNWKSSLEFNKMIYDGSAELLFSIIQRQSSKLNMICLIGHEPCISSFITTKLIQILQNFQQLPWHVLISKLILASYCFY